MRAEDLPKAYSKFLRFMEEVLRHGKKYNLSRETNEDIFQDSIMVCIKTFDKNKGDFRNFLITVFKNKLYDHVTRDKHAGIVAIGWDEKKNDVAEAEPEELNLPEGFLDHARFVNSLKKLLEESELKFFDTVYDQINMNSKYPVTDSARALGMEPAQGWNIWKRVMRKARKLTDERSDQILYFKQERPTLLDETFLKIIKGSVDLVEKPSVEYIKSQLEEEVKMYMKEPQFEKLSFLCYNDQLKFLKFFL